MPSLSTSGEPLMSHGTCMGHHPCPASGRVFCPCVRVDISITKSCSKSISLFPCPLANPHTLFALPLMHPHSNSWLVEHPVPLSH